MYISLLRVHGDANFKLSLKICAGQIELGIVVPPAPPKTPSSSEVVDEPSPSLIAEYECHIQFLQRSYASKKWSLASMVTLMEQTAVLRREWVKKEGPSVTQLMEKFPCLADPRIVRFCLPIIHVCVCMLV